MSVPFGAKVSWNDPKRKATAPTKFGPSSAEGIFLGYHITTSGIEVCAWNLRNAKCQNRLSPPKLYPLAVFMFLLKHWHVDFGESLERYLIPGPWEPL